MVVIYVTTFFCDLLMDSTALALPRYLETRVQAYARKKRCMDERVGDMYVIIKLQLLKLGASTCMKRGSCYVLRDD